MSGDEPKATFPENIVFGCTKSSGAPDVHVEDLWSNGDVDEYNEVKQAVLKTQSAAQVPQLSFPGFIMQDPKYRHGVTTCKSDEAKHLIYCDTSDHDKDRPGQQRTRNYRWPVDPESTTFGIKGEGGTGRGISAGVAEALHMPEEGNDVAARPPPDPGKIFGKSTSSPNSSAADCLSHTTADGTDLGAVDDIGKSLTPGLRNATTTRCFGCPSVRNDIPKYERASVADTQNYGDDVNAGYLLRPSLFSSFGLQEDELLRPRSKDYLRRLCRSCSLNIEDQVFDEMFARVADSPSNDVAGNNDTFVSIGSFRKAVFEELYDNTVARCNNIS